MANYYASCRSNYFAVKSEEAFREWADTVPDIEIHFNSEKFCLLGNNADGAGWPSYRCSEDSEDEDFDLEQELSEHLAEGEVAVLMEVGAEKLRYLVGYATAVSWTGEVGRISIDDVYAKAAGAFVGCNPISDCSY
jgi:hypothetical protein